MFVGSGGFEYVLNISFSALGFGGLSGRLNGLWNVIPFNFPIDRQLVVRSEFDCNEFDPGFPSSRDDTTVELHMELLSSKEETLCSRMIGAISDTL
jgi:hypothetical protein